MIEGSADFVPEEEMLKAVEYAQSKVNVIAEAFGEWAEAHGKPKRTDTIRKTPELLAELMDKEFGQQATDALAQGEKNGQSDAISTLDEQVKAFFVLEEGDEANAGGPSPIPSDGAGERFDATKNPTLPAEVPMDSAEIESLDLNDEEMVVREDDVTDDELKVDAAPATTGAARRSAVLFEKIDVQLALKNMLCDRLRRLVIETGRRTDGRLPETVRPLAMEVGLLPMAHGSALFTRGETQSIATATLGDASAEQKADSVDGTENRKFYLHYTFPPCSVGEVGRVGAPGRRELGHGNLAERALAPAVPSPEAWPYTTRVESLITESCGSSSMASVCGGSLALMHAGVPLKGGNVAGIAMGMLLPEDGEGEPVILSDILGVEDALGTMDFKTAGTRDGISTFQLDIKCEGLSQETMRRALAQAREGRLHILDAMDGVQAQPSEDTAATVPKMLTFLISDGSKGKVIGPGGKTVNGIIDEHGLENVNINDEGVVTVSSMKTASNEAAKAAILELIGEDGNPEH